MNAPKLHHYIPQMLLRQHTDKNGCIYVFIKDRLDIGVFRTTPGNVFAETGLYNQRYEDGTTHHEVESHLAEIEGEASRVINKVIHAIRNRELPKFTSDDKLAFARYYYTQLKRTPDALNMQAPSLSQENVGSTISQLVIEHQAAGGKPITPAERAGLHSPELIRNAKVDGVIEPGFMFDIISKCSLEIAFIARAGETFIVGSNPIVLPRFYNASTVFIPPIEWWLPIAPRVAIRPALDTWAGSLYGQTGYLRLGDGILVRDINAYMFKQSTIVAGNSRKLIESLAREMIAASN